MSYYRNRHFSFTFKRWKAEFEFREPAIYAGGARVVRLTVTGAEFRSMQIEWRGN